MSGLGTIKTHSWIFCPIPQTKLCTHNNVYIIHYDCFIDVIYQSSNFLRNLLQTCMFLSINMMNHLTTECALNGCHFEIHV